LGIDAHLDAFALHATRPTQSFQKTSRASIRVGQVALVNLTLHTFFLSITHLDQLVDPNKYGSNNEEKEEDDFSF